MKGLLLPWLLVLLLTGEGGYAFAVGDWTGLAKVIRE
jgi:hypothetical protein